MAGPNQEPDSGGETILDLEAIREAATVISTRMQPTPQIHWPQLSEVTGAQVVVKHENHTPIGAFKVRGGIAFVDWLKRNRPEARGIVTATRGNHGQSLARAATSAGLIAKVVVPHGNSIEKNEAMRGFGAELIVHGDDFDESKIEAFRLSASEHLEFVPPFHPELVRGVATYALEFFSEYPDLDTVYVPIGCGSGICGVIQTRDALGLNTRIVGVVSENAATAKLSAEAGRSIETNSARTFADGMAVRVPVPEALEIYSKGAERIVSVSDSEIAEAIRIYFRMTHNVAEGAGAAPLAALIKEANRMGGKRIGLVLSGGNIDTDWFATVLSGRVPSLEPTP